MTSISDQYQNLFGKGAITDGSVIDMAEHGRIGNVSTGQGLKYVGILNASGSLVSEFGGSSTGGSGIPVAGASLASPVAIVDGSGNQITTFGGGTQYAEGATAATGTGTLAMGKNGTTLKALQTDTSGNLGVYQTDGTNTAHILKSDRTAAGQNAQLVAGAVNEYTWSVSSVSNLTGIDVSNYKSMSVQIATMYAGSTPTITFEASNDNANWAAVVLAKPDNTLSSPSSSVTTVGIYTGPITFKYFRLKFTGTYSSGASTGTIEFYTHANPNVVTVTGQLALNGTQTMQGGKTNNAAAPSTNNIGALVGIANAAQPSWTEGNEVLNSTDLKGNQRTRIQDAAGNDRGANVNASNQLSVSVDSSVLPTGAATSAKQDSQITLQTQLESLVETLQELVQRLAPLAGAMSNTAQLRTVVTGAVTATGGGYITSAQSIAEKAVAGVLYPEKVAITNLTAIQSNINNAVAA